MGKTKNVNFDEFSRLCLNFWNGYFKYLQWLIDNAALEAKFLFPKIVLCTATEKYFFCELIGARKNFDGLFLKTNHQKIHSAYIGQFESDWSEEKGFILNSSRNEISGLCLLHQDVDPKEAEKKFPLFKYFVSKAICDGVNSTLINFGPEFLDAAISNSLLVHEHEGSVRARHICELLVVKSTAPQLEISAILADRAGINKIRGVIYTAGDENERLRIVASQLQNLYLTPKIYETTIGDFFDSHPEIIARSFGSSGHIYEPHLSWIEGSPLDTDTAINPDMLIKRSDGFYDIVDFKTALLGQKNLTRGERKRRRFKDEVNEGIAQLKHYAYYFGYKKNREFLMKKYGASVSEPMLHLIVGNCDNSEKNEIEEALRCHSGVTVTDYDSMVRKFLLENGISQS